MIETPLISIVTPSFNQAAFLRDCLESVRAQRGVRFEHLVMDGGSTDGSVEIIREFAAGLAHWQSDKDGGQTDALIRGFERSTGEILGWLNSDDYLWDDGALRAVAEAFAAHPEADLVTGDLVYVSPDRHPVMIDMVGRPTHRQLRHYMAIPQASTFWRRRAYDRVGGLDRSFNFCMDYDLFQRMTREGRVVRVPRALAAFRLQKASKTFTLQSTLAEEEARCRRNFLGRPNPGPSGKLVNLGIRAGSLTALAGAILSGRRLPTWALMRIEPMRSYALRRWGLQP